MQSQSRAKIYQLRLGGVLAVVLAIAILTSLGPAITGTETRPLSSSQIKWHDAQIQNARLAAANKVCGRIEPQAGFSIDRAHKDCGAAIMYCGHSIFSWDVAECAYERLTLPQNETDPSVRQFFTTELYIERRS